MPHFGGFAGTVTTICAQLRKISENKPLQNVSLRRVPTYAPSEPHGEEEEGFF